MLVSTKLLKRQMLCGINICKTEICVLLFFTANINSNTKLIGRCGWLIFVPVASCALLKEFIEDWKQKSLWVSAPNVYVVLDYAIICTLFVHCNFLPDLLPSFVLKNYSVREQSDCNKHIAKLIVSVFERSDKRAKTFQRITFHRLFYTRI